MTPYILPNAVHQLPWLPLTFSNAWSQGFEVFKAQYGLLLAGAGVAFGVQMAQTMIGQVFSIAGSMIDPTAGAIVSVLFSLIITVFVTWPMSVSTQYVGVAARRGEQISMRLLFRGFYRLGTAGLTMFLTSLIAFVCAIPCILVIVPMIVMASKGQASWELAIAVSAPVAVINGVAIGYVMSRLYVAPAMCVDSRLGNMSAIESLKTSWEWTRTRGWLVFMLMVTVGLAAAASWLLLCIGYFLLGTPLMLAVFGVVYHQLGFEAGVFPLSKVCPVCNYDLTGVNAITCPECGSNVAGYTSANEYAHQGAPPTSWSPQRNHGSSPTPPSTPPNTPPNSPQDPFGKDPYGPRDPNDPFGPGR